MLQAVGNQVYRSKVEQNYALRRLERQINQRLQMRGYDLDHLGAYNNYSFDNLYNQSYFDDLLHDPGYLDPGYSRIGGLGAGSGYYGGMGDRGLGYNSGLGYDGYDGLGGLGADRMYDGGLGGVDYGSLDGCKLISFWILVRSDQLPRWRTGWHRRMYCHFALTTSNI